LKDYELIFVTRPDLTDQDAGTVRIDVKKHIENLDGSMEKENLWGKRQLSFEIKDFTEGVYTHMDVKLPPENPGKLKDLMKIDERIIRYMITVKKPHKVVEPKS